MTPDFTLKKGDLMPALEVYLTDSTGAVVPNLNIATLTFQATRYRGYPTASKTISGAVTVEDAATGLVSFDWASVTDSTNTAGLYKASIIATFPGSKPAHFPGEGHLIIEIED